MTSHDVHNFTDFKVYLEQNNGFTPTGLRRFEIYDFSLSTNTTPLDRPINLHTIRISIISPEEYLELTSYDDWTKPVLIGPTLHPHHANSLAEAEPNPQVGYFFYPDIAGNYSLEIQIILKNNQRTLQEVNTLLGWALYLPGSMPSNLSLANEIGQMSPDKSGISLYSSRHVRTVTAYTHFETYTSVNPNTQQIGPSDKMPDLLQLNP